MKTLNSRRTPKMTQTLFPHKFIGTHQAARLLSVDAGTIIRWADMGRFPFFRTPGGHRRIRKDDLVRFALEHGWPMAEEGLA
jgi:excisionase family DNA binding protein